MTPNADLKIYSVLSRYCRADRLRKMEIVAVERAQLGILQRHRVVRISRNNNILAGLRSMCQTARETVENGLAELDHIVGMSACEEIHDHFVPEIRSEYEGIIVSIAYEQIVAPSACQRIAAGRAQDRAARTCHDVASTIQLLSRKRMRCVRYGRRGGVAPAAVSARAHRPH